MPVGRDRHHCFRRTDDQRVITMCIDGVGGAIVTWEDYRTDPVPMFTRRESRDGCCAWTANGVAVCNALTHSITAHH